MTQAYIQRCGWDALRFIYPKGLNFVFARDLLEEGKLILSRINLPRVEKGTTDGLNGKRRHYGREWRLSQLRIGKTRHEAPELFKK